MLEATAALGVPYTSAELFGEQRKRVGLSVEHPLFQGDCRWAGLKSRYRYLSVSASQNDCILLSWKGGTHSHIRPSHCIPPLATCSRPTFSEYLARQMQGMAGIVVLRVLLFLGLTARSAAGTARGWYRLPS